MAHLDNNLIDASIKIISELYNAKDNENNSEENRLLSEKIKQQLKAASNQTEIENIHNRIKAIDPTQLIAELHSIHTSLHNILRQEPPSPCNIFLFSTFDCEDHNLSMCSNLTQILEEANVKTNSPYFVVASRGMLCGEGQNFEETSTIGSVSRAKQLTQLSEHFDFVCQGDSELILFIPKKLDSHFTLAQKLAKHGFESKKFRSISSQEIFQGSKKKENIQEFYQLFNPQHPSPKHFYLVGHGGDEVTGGIAKDEFPAFLNFLNDHHAKTLYVLSCRAGGGFSQNYFSEFSDDPSKEWNHQNQFLTFVRSLGDFYTCGTVMNTSSYFRSMNHLENTKRSHLAQRFNEIRNSSTAGHQLSQEHKVLFPQAQDKGKGFRGFGSHETYALTPGALRKQSSNHSFKVEGKKYIEIYPYVSEVTLSLASSSPSLLSMTPGKAHHFVERIELEENDSSLAQWLENNDTQIYRHEHYKAIHQKAFFIHQLKDSRDEYSNCCIRILPKSTVWGGIKSGRCILSNPNQTMFCSTAALAVSHYTTFMQTQPTSKLNVSQQKQKMIEKLFSPEQWPASNPLPEFMKIYLAASNKEALRLEDFGTLTSDEKNALLWLALSEKHHTIALSLAQDPAINPNFYFLSDTSLLHMAVENEYLDVLDFLLKKGADVNFTFPHLVESPLIFQAFAKGNQDIIRRLLEEENLNLQATDSLGCNLWKVAAASDELTQLLTNAKQKGKALPDLNHKMKYGYTVLGLYVNKNNVDAVKRLSSIGADVNAGSPSPLIIAFQKKNAPMIELLMSLGAKINQEDAGIIPPSAPEVGAVYNKGGNLPSVEAVRNCSPEQLKTLLDCYSFDLIKKDVRGKNCLLAACERGNHEIIHLVITQTPKIPEQLAMDLFNIAFERNDRSLIRLFIENGLPSMENLNDQHIFDLFHTLLQKKYYEELSLLFSRPEFKIYLLSRVGVFFDEWGCRTEVSLFEKFLSMAPPEVRISLLQSFSQEDFHNIFNGKRNDLRAMDEPFNPDRFYSTHHQKTMINYLSTLKSLGPNQLIDFMKLHLPLPPNAYQSLFVERTYWDDLTFSYVSSGGGFTDAFFNALNNTEPDPQLLETLTEIAKLPEITLQFKARLQGLWPR